MFSPFYGGKEEGEGTECIFFWAFYDAFFFFLLGLFYLKIKPRLVMSLANVMFL